MWSKERFSIITTTMCSTADSGVAARAAVARRRMIVEGFAAARGRVRRLAVIDPPRERRLVDLNRLGRTLESRGVTCQCQDVLTGYAEYG